MSSPLGFSSDKAARLVVQDGLIGFKTSAAFISSLGANLRLDSSSPLPSPALSPASFQSNPVKPLSILGPDFSLPAATSLAFAINLKSAPKDDRPEPLKTAKPHSRSRSSSSTQSNKYQQSRPNLPRPPLRESNCTVEHAISPQDKQSAIDLIASSVSSQSLLAFRSLCIHPFNILGFLLVLLLVERCVQPVVRLVFAQEAALRYASRHPTMETANLRRIENRGLLAPPAFPFSPGILEYTNRIQHQAAYLQQQAIVQVQQQLNNNQGPISASIPARSAGDPDGGSGTLAWTAVGIAWAVIVLCAAAAMAWGVWWPYRQLGQDIRKEGWLSGDDVVLVARQHISNHDQRRERTHPAAQQTDGRGKIVGTLVLSWHSREMFNLKGQNQRKRRSWRGKVRAWSVELGSTDNGVGTAMLLEAARMLVSKGCAAGGEGLWFAEDHAHSTRILPDTFNGPFDRRDRRAKELLAEAVQEQQSTCSRKR